MLNCWLCKEDFEGEPNWTNCRLLCPTCYAKPRYRYFYINRPPGIGCQPEGFVDREMWMPAKPQLLIGRGEWNVLGWVEYPEPLDQEQIWLKELYPRNAWEVSLYLDWREENDR